MVADTLPSAIRGTPDRPWLPTPIRELPRSRARLTSTEAALTPSSDTRVDLDAALAHGVARAPNACSDGAAKSWCCRNEFAERG
jgi:hypothetical protein